MLFLAVGNAVFVIFLIVLYAKNLQLKKSSAEKISDLNQKILEAEKENQLMEERMRQELMGDSKKYESLLAELSATKKASEDEFKLRSEAEKQIALALQKTSDMQKKMKDWETAQNSAMDDAKDAIFEIGEEICHRLESSYQAESEQNKKLFEEIISRLTSKNLNQNSEAKIAIDDSKTTATHATTKNSSTTIAKEDNAKNLVTKFTQALAKSNQKYFTPASFDPNIGKMFFCETAVLHKDLLYIFDFKSCNFLEEFVHDTDEVEATKRLNQRLEKYIAYVGNPKYYASINKIISTTGATSKESQIFVVVPSDLEFAALQETGYHEKLEDISVRVVTFDDILDLTL